ncbi:hypothetical protein H4Q26_004622 [Puccinia striiformis f. sp. tritici PST-130]|nr:hypothetical protein H4Q26_004622 [Puccinia striiformis f. sp. tritici PST-130]
MFRTSNNPNFGQQAGGSTNQASDGSAPFPPGQQDILPCSGQQPAPFPPYQQHLEMFQTSTNPGFPIENKYFGHLHNNVVQSQQHLSPQPLHTPNQRTGIHQDAGFNQNSGVPQTTQMIYHPGPNHTVGCQSCSPRNHHPVFFPAGLPTQDPTMNCENYRLPPPPQFYLNPGAPQVAHSQLNNHDSNVSGTSFSTGHLLSGSDAPSASFPTSHQSNPWPQGVSQTNIHQNSGSHINQNLLDAQVYIVQDTLPPHNPYKPNYPPQHPPENHYKISTAPQPPMAEETTWQHQHPDHHLKTQSTSPKIIPQMPGISLEHTAPNLSTELDCLVVDRPEYCKKIVVNQEEEAGVQNMDLGANLRDDASLPEMKSDRAPKFGIETREKPEVLTSEGIEKFDYTVGQPMDPPPSYCFQSMEDLKNFTSKWALAHEYRLPTKSSNKNKNITLHCSLNGEDTTPAVDTTSPFNPRTRGSLNKRIGCPFVMTGSRSNAAGTDNLWTLHPPSATCSVHNHGPVDLCHEVPNLKVSDEGQAEVQRLCSLGMDPCVIARELSISQGRLVTSRTIYNTKAKINSTERRGKSTMEYLFDTLKETNWTHEYEHDAEGSYFTCSLRIPLPFNWPNDFTMWHW